MYVYRVNNTCLIAAASRRHSRRKPRTGPPRVEAMAVDKDPNTNKYVGFGRKEMGSEMLAGTVKRHDCHAFLVHGDAERWPGKEFETTGGDAASAMHEALSVASGLYKSGVFQFAAGSSAVGTVKLNLSEEGERSHPGDVPGDVLMFPQMRRHRLGRLDASTASACAAFVRDRVVVDGDGGGAGEAMAGAHVFVCTHGTRDARCGVCGPALVDAFRDAVKARGMEDVVAVRGCSHVGGHKYAGNVLIFLPEGGVTSERAGDAEGDGGGKTSGVWYGYVTPLEIHAILERTVGKGEIIPRLWRGSMGVAPEEHEAMAAAEAERLGEEWPPPPSPCDACVEGGGGGGGGSGGEGKNPYDVDAIETAVGDIEDVGGAVLKATATPSSGGGAAAAVAGAAAGVVAAPFPPLWVDNVLLTSALVGAVGLVASWFAAGSTTN